jgi:tight adherence protein B
MIINPWMLIAPIAPIGIMAAGLVLLRMQQKQKATQARINAVVSPVTSKQIRVSQGIARLEAGRKLEWRDWLGSIFGFSPAKADQYRVGWPWVLLITMLIGRVVAFLAAGMIGSTLSWLLMPIAWIVLSRTVFARSHNKRRSALLNQFPDALSLIVRAVRVGIPVTEALRAVAREASEPTAGEFNRVSDQIAIGTAPEQALRNMAARNGLPEYGFFAAALTLQAQTGGGLTETLELLAEVIRKRVALKARGYALSSEARTSSMVLGILPIATGGLITAMNPDYMMVLITDSTGNIILGIAILFLATGMFLMQTIIRKTLS